MPARQRTHDSFRYSLESAGLDWITWVEPKGVTSGRSLLIGRRLMEEERALGGKLRGFSGLGYSGWKCGRVTWGAREDGELLQISSCLAQSTWTHLRSSLGRPTRLDFQTTFRSTPSQKRLGTRILSPRATVHRSRSGRPPLKTESWATSGYYLGTVGRRTARSYLRIYDKGVEQGTEPPGTLWRIEWEAKRDLPGVLWTETKESGDASLSSLRFCERVCKSVDCWWPLPSSTEIGEVPKVAPRDPPEVERTLKWMDQMVRPAIERLLPSLGTERLLQALGLDAYAVPITSLTPEQRLT
jgi:DNA relaxase NicK